MINVRMQHKEVRKLSPRITVVGVGGAGGNAVNNMIASSLEGVEFVVCNTDAQALENSLCEQTVQLGSSVTGGLGAGARPEVGRAAAEETLDDVMKYLEGSNMVFVTAGMGGGTGTGAAPIIASAAREKGILTVGVVTKPFHFEGPLRMKMAEEGIRQMQEYVDTLIVIPNQNLFRIANEKTTFAEAFRMADSVLQSAVRCVTDLMVKPALINLDFSDVRTTMMEMGKAIMGMGESVGDRRAIEAAEAAINNPLLDDVSMKGARGVIINVTGGNDMTLFEIDEACNRVRDEVDPNANIIFGATIDPEMDGIMRVSLVATGIDTAQRQASGPMSNTMINVLTSAQQNERKLERARPNTATAEVQESVPVSAYAMPSAPSRVSAAASAPVNAPAPVSRPVTAAHHAMPAYAGSAAYRVDDTPVAQQAGYAEADVAPVQTYAYQHSYHQQQDAVRASRHQDAFIPPAPVEAQPPVQMSYGEAPASAYAQSQTQQTHAQAQPSGLTLRPPVSGAAAPTKKRMPSLFERFTHGLRHEEDAVSGTADETSSSGESAGGLRASPRQTYRTPQQGSLNIDAPVATRPAAPMDEEIDIPAFLRRQAN